MLDAQRRTEADYVRYVGGITHEEFIKVESGTRKDRPDLLKALAAAQYRSATLLVAKLDRRDAIAANGVFLNHVRNSSQCILTRTT